MTEQIEVKFPLASLEERQSLLALIQSELSDEFQAIQRVLGLSWPQLIELYDTRGEVRAITVGGMTVGLCWVELREYVLHIHALFVLPEQRGKGVGRAALLGLERQFADRAGHAELGVKESNDNARRLYERCNFVTEGAVPELGYLIMRKTLSGGRFGKNIE